MFIRVGLLPVGPLPFLWLDGAPTRLMFRRASTTCDLTRHRKKGRLGWEVVRNFSIKATWQVTSVVYHATS